MAIASAVDSDTEEQGRTVVYATVEDALRLEKFLHGEQIPCIHIIKKLTDMGIKNVAKPAAETRPGGDSLVGGSPAAAAEKEFA